jgi:tetratricopeptide (TPR) repeat protein
MGIGFDVPPAASVAHTKETPTGPGLFSSARKRSLILSLILVLATVCVYRPLVYNSFINVDDNGYVTENTHVQQGLTPATLKWALTTFDCENWHPLTWVSHALDWELFGKNPAGHHFMSALIHALNAVLLFLLLQKATGFTWRSLIVAALFALHTVNVESVAWASERKNVLSMTFFLLALMAYGWYAERPSVRRYLSVALLSALALMAKPQVVTLPCVLLLWDYWPLQRFGSRRTMEGPSRYTPASFQWLALEKLPVLLLAGGEVLLTMRAQHNAVRSANAYSLSTRIANALVSYARYVGHAFWPVKLSPAYPHPGNGIPLWQSVSAGAFLLLVTALVLLSKKRHLQVGWLWFLGILVPMIGIVQVGDQAMADRYAYIPFIGLFWMVVWTVAETAYRWQISPRWLTVPACLAIAGAAAFTPRQVTYWHDSETLWRYALSVTDHNFMAHSYLAEVLTKEDRHEEAMKEYLQAEQIHAYPLTQVVYFADYELRHSHLAGAITDAQRVVQGTNDPTAREMAFRDLGIANTQLGKSAEARENYSQALRLDPRDPYALMGLGLLAYRESDFTAAADFFSRATAVDPSDFDYLLLATALQQAGRKAEANTAYEQAQTKSADFKQAQEKAHWFLTN